jgi:hypothetical protein
MKRREFLQLVEKAKAGPVCLDKYGFFDYQEMWRVMEPLDGLALHKERVMVSEVGAITFIRYQALQLDGTWNYTELGELARCFRRVDLM